MSLSGRATTPHLSTTSLADSQIVQHMHHSSQALYSGSGLSTMWSHSSLTSSQPFESPMAPNTVSNQVSAMQTTSQQSSQFATMQNLTQPAPQTQLHAHSSNLLQYSSQAQPHSLHQSHSVTQPIHSMNFDVYGAQPALASTTASTSGHELVGVNSAQSQSLTRNLGFFDPSLYMYMAPGSPSQTTSRILPTSIQSPPE